MACDRFVYWNEKKPTREKIQLVLEDYVRDLAVEIKWERDRFMVLLPGMGSHPLGRVIDSDVLRLLASEERKNERWFEVWMGDDCLDVITRHADEVTGNIASGFARLCARFWNGRLQEG